MNRIAYLLLILPSTQDLESESTSLSGNWSPWGYIPP